MSDPPKRRGNRVAAGMPAASRRVASRRVASRRAAHRPAPSSPTPSPLLIRSAALCSRPLASSSDAWLSGLVAYGGFSGRSQLLERGSSLRLCPPPGW